MVMLQRIHLNLFYVCANNFLLCFLNEGQFKASFVKKLKLKDGSVPIVHDPAAPPEVGSLTLNIFFNDYLRITLLFHRREGWGEQSSLSCKEICTETSHCEQNCF